MEQGVWQERTVILKSFRNLVSMKRWTMISTTCFLITHSTAIEGSTLTELDTQLFFDEGSNSERETACASSDE